MTNKVDNKKFWEDSAKKHTHGYAASWGDKYMIDLEIQNLSKIISNFNCNEGNVLNVGCANAYSFIKLVDVLHNPYFSYYGIDLCEDMIKYAKENTDNHSSDFSFKVGDVRELPYESNSMSITYTTRVLINLPNWEDQKKALDELLRVTASGGIVVIQEAFELPLSNINKLRDLNELPPLVEPKQNVYLKHVLLDEYFTDRKLKVHNYRYSDFYYLGSRVLRDISNNTDPEYSSSFNSTFYNLSSLFSLTKGMDLSVQQTYVIYKED